MEREIERRFGGRAERIAPEPESAFVTCSESSNLMRLAVSWKEPKASAFLMPPTRTSRGLTRNDTIQSGLRLAIRASQRGDIFPLPQKNAILPARSW